MHQLYFSCWITYRFFSFWNWEVFEIPLRSELIAYARCWAEALVDVVSESQLYSVHFVLLDFTSVITHFGPQLLTDLNLIVELRRYPYLFD